MLCLVCVLNHVVKSLHITSTEHNKTHGETNRLTIDSRVSVEHVLEFLVDFVRASGHTCNTKTQGTTVLYDFFLSRLKLFTEIVQDVSAVIGVDETESVE